MVPHNDPAMDIKRKLDIDPELFLVGLLEEVVVATVMGGYEGHRGWINYLAVKPSYQRDGHGRAMMVAVEALMQKKGCPKINLQVRSANKEVRAFYLALGYVDDDVVSLGKHLE